MIKVNSDDFPSVESQLEQCVRYARSEGLIVADEHVFVDVVQETQIREVEDE